MENTKCVLVGYLVPSKKVKGELEFKKCIDSEQSHLNLYYDLKNEFNLEESYDTIIAEVKGQQGYHMLEPLYKSEKTNSLIYIDTFNAVTYDSSELLTSKSAYEVVMEHIEYQLTYSKDILEVMLNNINIQDKGIAKRK